MCPTLGVMYVSSPPHPTPLPLNVHSGVTAGGGGRGSVPLTLLTEKFLLTYWKKRGKEKKENGEEKKENKRRWKMRRGFFSFHFSRPLKFVSGLPKWEFSTGKKHFKPGKKSVKMTLPTLKNTPLTPLDLHACQW